MSQAEALLNSLTDINVASETNNTAEAHIVVDEERFIHVPEELRRLGVEHDHNIETITFDCPRYWDGHDMSQFKIYVNYLCPDGIKGQYLTTNLVVGYDTMNFDWVISNNVTRKNGPISFLVCIVKTNAEGIEERHWNSELNQECFISEGLECEEAMLVGYPDIITHLLVRMEEVDKIATTEAMQQYTDEWLAANHDRLLAEIEAKGKATLDSIPEDYATVAALANEGARTKADAIVCSAEGEEIIIEDSSDDFFRALTLYGKTTQVTTTGKNLANPRMLPFGFSSTVNGCVLGHNEFEYCCLCVPVTAGNIYTVSRGAVLGSRFRYGFTVAYPEPNAVVESTDTAYSTTYDQALKMTTVAVPQGYNYLLVYLTNSHSTERVENTWYQVELGPLASAYEPYSGGVASPSPGYPQALSPAISPSVHIFSRNLIPSITEDKTYAGITFARNDDGSITINGTSTSYSSCSGPDIDAKPFRGKTLTLRGSGTMSNLVVTQIRFDWTDGYIFKSINGLSKGSILVPDEAETMHFEAYVPTDKTITNVTVYPQLVVGSKLPDYEPYQEVQVETFDADNLLALQYHGVQVASNGNYVDENGKHWICDELDFESGKYTRRIGLCDPQNASVVDYMLLDATGRGQLVLAPSEPKNQKVYGTLCNMARYNSDPYSAVAGEYYENPANIVIVGEVGEDETSMRDKYAHVQYVYVLETPVVSYISNDDIAVFERLRTKHHISTIVNDGRMYMKVKYDADTKTYLDNLPKATDDQVQAAVDAWLSAHYVSAEGVSF